MDGHQVKAWESRCIEEAPPACNAACPLHVDARGLAELLAKGDFKAAHALYCRFIPFPEIVGRICDHPCEQSCRRREAGDPIRIHALERAVVGAGYNAPRIRTGRATERKRVAVVGAGLSGLTVAADLTARGHSIVVFEAGAVPLERLRARYPDSLPDSAIAADLARFEGTAVEFRYAQAVDAGALADAFDAVYLGCGNDGIGVHAAGPDGRIDIDPLTYATNHPRIFAGGSLRYGAAYSPITSLADGRYAALSIDRLLQGASLTANRDHQGSQPTRLYVNVARHAPLPAVAAADPAQGYTADEAIAEAKRCFPCHCLECVRACPYLEHYCGYTKRYIREIYNNETIVMGARKSNRMIDSCTLCGLCAEVCPENLGMGEVCLSARQGMTAKGKMPPSHHDFALRDLAYARSEAFALTRHQPGHTRSAALFYPGCQLAASSPEHVERVYAHLCATSEGGVGLWLGCCGAPAQWAGRQDLQAQIDEEFAVQWRQLGRPRLITACSSCYRSFADRHPEVELQSLWSVLADAGLPGMADDEVARRKLAIHDPCTTRHEAAMHADVRRLAARLGVDAIELDGAQRTTCCGFGGLASFVNPALTDQIVDRRIASSPADFLTYCAMCRDNFARRGKRALHLLDLVFPDDGDSAARPDPGFSQRQENRGRLKRRLLRRLWEEAVDESVHTIDLCVAADVATDLERKLILLDDVRQTIAHAEASGEKLIDPASGHFIASHRRVAITYWVEYAPRTGSEGGFTVFRAYSHRMQLEQPS